MNKLIEIQNYLDKNLERYFQLLQLMVGINSFTSNSIGVNSLGKLTRDIFASLGFSTTFVQSTNPNFGKHLFANIPSIKSDPLKPTIALISHLDTVYPPEEEKENDFFWREEDDRLYGPGTVDIKGGTIIIFMILDVIKKFFPSYFKSINWEIFLNASEEALASDFGILCKAKLPENTMACLVFEAGNQANNNFSLVTTRKGRATFNIQVEGRSAHAGNYHIDGANAIHQLARTIEKVSMLTNYENKITFNVGTILGGTVVNRVPHHAEAKVEMRAFSTEIFNQGIEDMLSIMEESTITAANGYKCKVSIAVEDQTDPWPRNPQTNFLFSQWLEAAHDLNFSAKEDYRGGLSDGNLLWRSFPTLDGLGPSGGNAHCSQKSTDGSKDQEFVFRSSFIPKTILNVISILKIISKNTTVN